MSSGVFSSRPHLFDPMAQVNLPHLPLRGVISILFPPKLLFPAGVVEELVVSHQKVNTMQFWKDPRD